MWYKIYNKIDIQEKVNKFSIIPEVIERRFKNKSRKDTLI